MAVAEHRFRVMGSEAVVLVVGGPSAAAIDARRRLDHLERVWSRFLPDSDLSALNRCAGTPVRVDPATLTLLDTMTAAWRATDGAFDPTLLLPLLDLGYVASIHDNAMRTSLPDPAPLATSRPTLDDVVVTRDRCLVTLPPGLMLDPGGIGKGLAADLAVQALLEDGASAALVSVGGDLRAGGRVDGGWNVEVEHPRAGDTGTDDAVHCILSIDTGGVATSSTRSRRWVHLGREVHHVVDPVDGEPSGTDLDAVTVVARSGWLAEAHATAAVLAGSAGVLDHFRRNELSGLAFTADGAVLASDDLRGVAA